MNTTSSSETSNHCKTNDHDQTLIQQRQNADQHDFIQDQNDTTQPRQERQCTPVHPDPMVCAARPDGPAAKIQTTRVVGLVLAVPPHVVDLSAVGVWC